MDRAGQDGDAGRVLGDQRLKGALHTHTTCSDGSLLPMEVLRLYHKLGFDFVALTDHDFLITPAAYANVPDEYEEMIVFKGIERTVFARGYVHVNEIPGDREMLRIFNHPAEYDFSVARVLDCLEEINLIKPIHAVEVTAKGYYTPEYDIAEIPYPKVATDDSHTRGSCGRAWITVSCVRDRDAILRAIKQGQAQIHCPWTSSQIMNYE